MALFQESLWIIMQAFSEAVLQVSEKSFLFIGEKERKKEDEESKNWG